MKWCFDNRAKDQCPSCEYFTIKTGSEKDRLKPVITDKCYTFKNKIDQ